MKNRHYLHNKRCIKCNKLISDYAIRCNRCEAGRKLRLKLIDNRGKNNGSFKSGRWCKVNLPKCKVCHKQLASPEANYCHLHANRLLAQKSSRNNKMKKDIVRHHLYGKNSDKIMFLSRGLHYLLHHEAYFYILEKYGQKEIRTYIRWFKHKHRDVNRRK
jgi:hypothetical protein